MELFHVEKKAENSPRLVLFTHKSGSVIITNKRANIEKLEDFRGKTVLIPHFLSIHNLIFDKMLRAKGMSIGVGKENDVRFEVVAPSEIPEIMEYDEKGTVGGFIVAEPYGSQVVHLGFGEEFALSKDIWPKHPCCVLVVKNEIVQRSPEAVAELVDSLVKSGQFITDNPAGAAEVGAKFLGQDVSVMMHVLTEPKDRVVTDELMPNVQDLEAIQNYMTQTIKALSDKVDLGKFVDTRFATAAGAK
jgi:NitT/TauT family transport system substrate-binding protein